jgi:hypothetical protein
MKGRRAAMSQNIFGYISSRLVAREWRPGAPARGHLMVSVAEAGAGTLRTQRLAPGQPDPEQLPPVQPDPEQLPPVQPDPERPVPESVAAVGGRHRSPPATLSWQCAFWMPICDFRRGGPALTPAGARRGLD